MPKDSKNEQRLLVRQFDFEKEQAELKQQHGITDEKTVVVERKSRVAQIWRITLATLLRIISMLAYICVAVLAIIGLGALVFPSTRAELLILWQTTLEQITAFTGLGG